MEGSGQGQGWSLPHQPPPDASQSSNTDASQSSNTQGLDVKMESEPPVSIETPNITVRMENNGLVPPKPLARLLAEKSRSKGTPAGSGDETDSSDEEPEPEVEDKEEEEEDDSWMPSNLKIGPDVMAKQGDILVEQLLILDGEQVNEAPEESEESGDDSDQDSDDMDLMELYNLYYPEDHDRMWSRSMVKGPRIPQFDDDLDIEGLGPLPDPHPCLPYTSDALVIVEMVHMFKDTIFKDLFAKHNKVTFEQVIAAAHSRLEKEAEVYTEIILFLLSYLITDKSTAPRLPSFAPEEGVVVTEEGERHTAEYTDFTEVMGAHLKQKMLTRLTLTETLRLYLLSKSATNINLRCSLPWPAMKRLNDAIEALKSQEIFQLDADTRLAVGRFLCDLLCETDAVRLYMERKEEEEQQLKKQLRQLSAGSRQIEREYQKREKEVKKIFRRMARKLRGKYKRQVQNAQAAYQMAKAKEAAQAASAAQANPSDESMDHPPADGMQTDTQQGAGAHGQPQPPQMQQMHVGDPLGFVGINPEDAVGDLAGLTHPPPPGAMLNPNMPPGPPPGMAELGGLYGLPGVDHNDMLLGLGTAPSTTNPLGSNHPLAQPQMPNITQSLIQNFAFPGSAAAAATTAAPSLDASKASEGGPGVGESGLQILHESAAGKRTKSPGGLEGGDDEGDADSDGRECVDAMEFDPFESTPEYAELEKELELELGKMEKDKATLDEKQQEKSSVIQEQILENRRRQWLRPLGEDRTGRVWWGLHAVGHYVFVQTIPGYAIDREEFERSRAELLAKLATGDGPDGLYLKTDAPKSENPSRSVTPVPTSEQKTATTHTGEEEAAGADKDVKMEPAPAEQPVEEEKVAGGDGGDMVAKMEVDGGEIVPGGEAKEEVKEEGKEVKSEGGIKSDGDMAVVPVPEPMESFEPEWWGYFTLEQASQVCEQLCEKGAREHYLKQGLRAYLVAAEEQGPPISQDILTGNVVWRTADPETEQMYSREQMAEMMKQFTLILEEFEQRITGGTMGELKERDAWVQQVQQCVASGDAVASLPVLAKLLTTLVLAINYRMFKKPFLNVQRGMPEDEPSPQLLKWCQMVEAATSYAQLAIYLSALREYIAWEKSTETMKCTKCKKKGDDMLMLLCDGCDRGFHTYCLKPPLDDIPEGDWFCPECIPCQVCGKATNRKDMVLCGACKEGYHMFCFEPPLEQLPAETWYCDGCKTERLKKEEERKNKKSGGGASETSASAPVVMETGVGKRRRAKVNYTEVRSDEDLSDGDGPRKKKGKTSGRGRGRGAAAASAATTHAQVARMAQHMDLPPPRAPMNIQQPPLQKQQQQQRPQQKQLTKEELAWLEQEELARFKATSHSGIVLPTAPAQSPSGRGRGRGRGGGGGGRGGRGGRGGGPGTPDSMRGGGGMGGPGSGGQGGGLGDNLMDLGMAPFSPFADSQIAAMASRGRGGRGGGGRGGAPPSGGGRGRGQPHDMPSPMGIDPVAVGGWPGGPPQRGMQPEPEKSSRGRGRGGGGGGGGGGGRGGGRAPVGRGGGGGGPGEMGGDMDDMSMSDGDGLRDDPVRFMQEHYGSASQRGGPGPRSMPPQGPPPQSKPPQQQQHQQMGPQDRGMPQGGLGRSMGLSSGGPGHGGSNMDPRMQQGGGHMGGGGSGMGMGGGGGGGMGMGMGGGMGNMGHSGGGGGGGGGVRQRQPSSNAIPMHHEKGRGQMPQMSPHLGGGGGGGGGGGQQRGGAPSSGGPPGGYNTGRGGQGGGGQQMGGGMGLDMHSLNQFDLHKGSQGSQNQHMFQPPLSQNSLYHPSAQTQSSNSQLSRGGGGGGGGSGGFQQSSQQDFQSSRMDPPFSHPAPPGGSRNSGGGGLAGLPGLGLGGMGGGGGLGGGGRSMGSLQQGGQGLQGFGQIPGMEMFDPTDFGMSMGMSGMPGFNSGRGGGQNDYGAPNPYGGQPQGYPAPPGSMGHQNYQNNPNLWRPGNY